MVIASVSKRLTLRLSLVSKPLVLTHILRKGSIREGLRWKFGMQNVSLNTLKRRQVQCFCKTSISLCWLPVVLLMY